MLTRRLFIERVAALGGVTLAYETMTGLGLLEAAQHTPFQLTGRVNGTKVIVIGAGIAGLTVAYELNKLGYAVQVLEARSRPGGRAHTVRRGTLSEEDGPAQVCEFDDGLYFNCGAMRVAHHHETTIAYARELNVPVEVFAVAADNAYLYQTRAAAMNGTRVRLRQVRTDVDGYVAELLAKSISQHALDEAITAADRERLLDHLRTVGRLDPQGKYTGNPTMRGPDDQRATDGSTQSTPMSLSDLLGSRLGYQVDLSYDYQPTMLQIVGGTDNLPRAIAAKIKDRITYQAVVREIRQSERGVSIVYADKGGRLHKVEAEYAVCAMPPVVLADIDADFAPEFKQAITSIPYAAAGKIGMQFKRRFWEEDDHIFGGASKTDQEIAQIIYPSTGFLGKKGTLVGYYMQGQAGRPTGDKTPQERLALALEQGRKIHPQYDTEFENAFSVAWHRVRYSKGSWASGAPDARRVMHVPDRRVYFAGDQLDLNSWMQGAFASARKTATALHARVSTERPVTASRG